jgi:hypothetical protein
MGNSSGEIGLEIVYLLNYTNPKYCNCGVRLKDDHYYHMKFRDINTTLPPHISSSGDEFEYSLIGYFAYIARNGWIGADDFKALLADTERKCGYSSQRRTEFTNNCVNVFLSECSRL